MLQRKTVKNECYKTYKNYKTNWSTIRTNLVSPYEKIRIRFTGFNFVKLVNEVPGPVNCSNYPGKVDWPGVGHI